MDFGISIPKLHQNEQRSSGILAPEETMGTKKQKSNGRVF
jgi:hypothetical protein